MITNNMLAFEFLIAKITIDFMNYDYHCLIDTLSGPRIVIYPYFQFSGGMRKFYRKKIKRRKVKSII